MTETARAKAQQRREDLASQQVKSFYEALVVGADKDNAVLPERVFVNTFLPFFAGQPVDEEKVNLSVWSGIAGNPYRSVNIIGDNNEILYTIPPLFDRDAIDITKARDGNVSPMAHVMETYQQLNRLSPYKAESYMDQEFEKRNILLNVSANTEKNIGIWNSIFKRYNLPLLQTQNGEVPVQPAENNTSIELDYGDDIL